MAYSATYSPEDNKLRFYSDAKPGAETLAKLRSHGFKYAPKQQLHVAPMWTPAREDLLIELCGEIGDEDTSLVDRAEERSERFEDYSEKRGREADRALAAVEQLTDGIPLGQPILVGHHSEKHARKHAEKIQSGTQKAVKLWSTSKYWTERAKSALSHAKYKERPDVRFRRLKGLKADERRYLKEIDRCQDQLRLWDNKGQPLTVEQAKAIANYDRISRCFPLAEYPRELPASQYEGDMSLYGALEGVATVAQVTEIALRSHRATIEWYSRWLEHTRNRLAYEQAMLGEQGGPPDLKWDLQVGGKVLVERSWLIITKINMKDGRVVSVTTNSKYVRVKSVEEISDYQAPTPEETQKIKEAVKLPPMCNYPGEGFQHMTKAEWAKVHSDYRGKHIFPATDTTGAYRVRRHYRSLGALTCVFLTDDKVKEPPKITDARPYEPVPVANGRIVTGPNYRPLAKSDPADVKFEAAAETLRGGIRTVSAPQLFQTPVELARRMVQLADIQPGHRVLEPSGGLGRLLEPMFNAEGTTWLGEGPYGRLVVVEQNYQLWEHLVRTYPVAHVIQADFLEYTAGDKFDRIVANPPFQNGADIKHINRMMELLKPGGRIVTLCAAGSRQEAAFKTKGDFCVWEDLPADTFKEAGTSVRAALLVIDN